MAKGKSVLTTGDVARICHVAPRTVSKWFDKGQLKGYRIPGSKDRRIPVSELIRFMKANNMPMENIGLGKIRIMVIDSDATARTTLCEMLRTKGNYDVQSVSNAFESGVAAQKFLPHVILINLLAKNVDANEIRENIRRSEELQTAKIIAVANQLREQECMALLQKGFDGCICNPNDAREVIGKVEEAMAIIY